MKKSFYLIWTISLVLFLYSATAHATVTTFVLDAAEAASPTFLRGGGAQQYLVPKSATSHLPTMGTASSSGISRNMIARVGGFKGIATVGIVAVAGYAAWVDAHPSDFPISYKLLHPTLTPPITAAAHDTPLTVGSYYSFNGNTYKVTAEFYSQGPHRDWTNGVGVVQEPTQIYIYFQRYYSYSDSNYYYVYCRYYSVVKETPPSTVTNATPEQVAIGLGLNELYPESLPEIDKYIQANPSAVSVPSTLATDVAKAVASDASARQAAADAERVATLQQIKDAAQTRYNANPTPENLDELNKAIADLDGAISDQAANEKQLADNDSAAPPPVPEYDELNFQPLQDMGEELGDKFPFTLLSTLKNFALGLVSTPQAPTFTIDFPSPFNYSWHVSLERFDGIARMVRVLIGMAFLAYVTMALLRRFH